MTSELKPPRATRKASGPAVYLPWAAIVYCACACLLLAAYAVNLRGQQQRLQSRIAPTRAALTSLGHDRAEAEAAYRRESDVQEQQRAAYNGSEAVQQSIVVQSAKQEYEELKAAQDKLSSDLAALEARERAAALRWVPVLALLLSHVLGLLIVRQRLLAMRAR